MSTRTTRPPLPRPAAPRPESFTSRLHDPVVAARVGRWLGVCFAVAFLTGVLSHYAQLPHPPVPVPTRPVWGYRVTQGLHVVAGTAAVPLLLVKLWTVYPRLFARLPRGRGPVVVTALERGSIAVLVGAALFEVSTGLANVTQWYPWDFSFRRSHYAMAWLAIGALLVHIAVKLPVIRAALGDPLDDDPDDLGGGSGEGSAPVTRRALLRGTWLAAAIAAVASAGGTLPLLDRFAVLAPRRADGPQGIPINRTARAAGVTASATAPDWVCEVRSGDRAVRLDRAALRALPQHTERLPIACVEGWSASGDWTGVRVSDLVALVGAPAHSEVAVHSLQRSGGGRFSVLPASYVAEPRTLLALDLAGEPLTLDHGAPARIIAPNRPGVLQTKWVTRLEVLG